MLIWEGFFAGLRFLRFDPSGGVIVGYLSDVAIPLLSGYCFDGCFFYPITVSEPVTR